MKFKVNESNLDRIVRFILAVVALYFGFITQDLIVKIILILSSIGLFFNSVTGFCGIYSFLGISTCKITPKSKNK